MSKNLIYQVWAGEQQPADAPALHARHPGPNLAQGCGDSNPDTRVAPVGRRRYHSFAGPFGAGV